MQLPTQQTHQTNFYTLGDVLTLRPTSWIALPPGTAYEDDIADNNPYDTSNYALSPTYLNPSI
jgi:hypothetical protein